MNRPGLAELGVHLPPVAVTSAGALPAPPPLREARLAHARALLSDAELAEETHRACEYWIGVQERLGLDVLVDGDFGPRDLVCRFTDGLAGFTPGGLVRIYGDRYRRKPIIAGPVSWREPIVVDSWQSLQTLTARPLKARITGPYTLARWSFDAHYGSRAAACLAIAAALRQEVNALVAAGARVVQLDEPALVEPGAEWGLAAEALRLVTTGIGAYVIARTGRAELESTDPTFGLPVDNLELPAVEELAALPEGMDATLDLSVFKVDQMPSDTIIDQRLQHAVATYGMERLWISAPWFLRQMTPDRAEAHLEAAVRAAAAVRGQPEATGDAAPAGPDASTEDGAPTADLDPISMAEPSIGPSEE